MGWASANPIFDRTVRAMFDNDVPAEAATNVLAELIDALRDGDWDTEGESYEEFAQYPHVRAAFAKAMPDWYGPDGPIDG